MHFDEFLVQKGTMQRFERFSDAYSCIGQKECIQQEYTLIRDLSNAVDQLWVFLSQGIVIVIED